jgi:hypothetical protein
MCCPYCKAKVKYPSRKHDYYVGYTTPTTFECGTATSKHWSPPVQSKECVERTRREHGLST